MNRSYDGVSDIAFEKRGDRTVLTNRYRSGNSRISAQIPTEDNTPLYFLVATGGGFVEGEKYYNLATLEKDAHAILTTQTPNYIYKCPNGKTTSQLNEVVVKENAFLEYYIDEVIPYEDAIYYQKTFADIKKGGSLILTDGLTAGWSKSDTPFLYNKVDLKTKILYDDELVFNDYLIVNPREENMGELGLFEGYTNFNSVVIIDENFCTDWIKRSKEALDTKEFEGIYGITALEKYGFVLRILGRSSHNNLGIMWDFINFYREEIRGLKHLELRKNQR